MPKPLKAKAKISESKRFYMKLLENFYIKYKKLCDLALYENIHKKYRKKIISKKNGGKRKLLIPPKSTDNVQKKLNLILQEIYKPPLPVHAFVKSEKDDIRNIISNAKQHQRKAFVINVDIENFFDSINFGRIRGLFIAKPFEMDDKIATKLAQLISYDNKLPQGSATSPIISNFICKKMDHNFIKFSKQNSLTYSRYADDITFSTYDKNINTDQILLDVEKILLLNGFNINSLKTRVQCSNQSQVVTGLKVNEKVNLNRKFIRQIRSMLHSWNTLGLEEASLIHFKYFNKQPKKYLNNKEKSFKNILLGKINFIAQVKGKDDSIFIKLKHTFYLLKNNFSISAKYDDVDYFEKFDFYDMKKERAILLLTQIYNSLLVFTEGVTDIVYIKEALKYFNKRSKYLDLKLRYCYFGGYADIIIMHRILYDKHIIKMGNLNELDIANIRKCILPYIDKKLKFSFVLDADEIKIEKHFEKNDYKNHFLLDIQNKGFVEKLIDEKIIIGIIKKHGYPIDVKRKGLNPTTVKKINDYNNIKNKYKNIESVTSYIAYGKKIIEKTRLATLIAKEDDINYDNFKNLFDFLEKINHNFTQPDTLCCNSIY